VNTEFIPIFRLLATGFLYPRSENTSPEFFNAIKELALHAGAETGGFSFDRDELAANYTRLFINSPGGVPAPPYASVYIAGQGLLMQDGHSQAYNFYQRAGLEPVSREEPCDFLAMELFFLAELLERDDFLLLSEFLNTHLNKWVPVFVQKVQSAETDSFYSLLSWLTLFYLRKLSEEDFDEAT